MEMGRDREEKTHKARDRETERTGLGRARNSKVEEAGDSGKTDRSWYGRLIAPSACHMLDLLRVLTASSWQPQSTDSSRDSRASLPGFKSQLGQSVHSQVFSTTIWNVEPTSPCQWRLRRDEASLHLCPGAPVAGPDGCSKSMLS